MSPRPQDGGTRSEATQGGVNPTTSRFAVLLGSDHTELESVAIRELPPTLAIGISRGRFPKGYPHLDPNEDAVYAATDETLTILAVADGHHGFDAARAAIQRIADTVPDSLHLDPAALTRHLAEAAIEAVADTIPNLASPRDTSRTSLTICVIDDTALATTTIGDTACYIATKRRLSRIGKESDFLGPQTDPRSIAVDTAPTPPRATTVVVASDGLVDFAPDLTTSLRSTLNLTAREAADLLIEHRLCRRSRRQRFGRRPPATLNRPSDRRRSSEVPNMPTTRWGHTTIEQQPSLFESLWRHKLVIILATIVAGIAAYAISSTQPPVYKAEGSVLVADPRGSAVITDPFTAYIDRGRYVRNEAEVLKSRAVAEGASEILGGDPDADEIQSVITANGEYEYDVLTIGATQPTASGAIDVVNAVVMSYEQVVAEETQTAAQEAVSSLQNSKLELQVRVAETEAALAEAPDNAALQSQRTAQLTQLAALDAQIEQIAVSSALYGSGVRLYDEPQDATRTAPRPLRNAAIAGVLGLIAAGAWAWWRDEQRDQVETRQAPAATLDAPLLGTVPEFSSVKTKGPAPTVTAPNSVAADAYHFIVSSLKLAMSHIDGSTVVVTSTGPEDGKTVTALNLAVAAAGGGQRPLLIDADVRTRGLTNLANLAGVPGLTDLTDNSGNAADLERRWGLGNGVELLIVPAGSSRSGDPARFFRSSAFGNAMETLTGGKQLVIVDAPPILAVSETTDITHQADAVLLVVCEGTSLKRLAEARSRIELTGKPIVGYVYNRSTEASSKTGYGYGYGKAIEKSKG